MVDRHQLGSPRDEDKGSGLIEEKSEYQRTTQDDRGSGFASLAQDEGEHPDSAGQEHQRRRLISDEMPIVRGGQRGAPRLGVGDSSGGGVRPPCRWARRLHPHALCQNMCERLGLDLKRFE